MTEKQLTRLYKTYNRKFFDGKLPETIPIVLVDMSQGEDIGVCTTVQLQGVVPLHSIYLDSSLKDRDPLMKFSLLHEMAHAKLHPDGTHDGGPAERAFDDEMLRLACRGAFHKLW
jgi:hypothetical protein